MPDSEIDPHGHEVEAQSHGAAGPLVVGSSVELKKPHACGGRAWKVERIGADVGLACHHCGRRLLLSRLEFQRRLRRIVPVA